MTLLNEQIRNKINELKYLRKEERSLVNSIITRKLTNVWDIGDRSIIKEIDRAINYIKRSHTLFPQIKKEGDVYRVRISLFSKLDEIYTVCKFKDISAAVDWKNAFKRYINDYPTIWSLDEWKKSLSLNDIWDILEEQAEENRKELVRITHPKIRVKDIVLIKL